MATWHQNQIGVNPQDNQKDATLVYTNGSYWSYCTWVLLLILPLPTYELKGWSINTFSDLCEIGVLRTTVLDHSSATGSLGCLSFREAGVGVGLWHHTNNGCLARWPGLGLFSATAKASSCLSSHRSISHKVVIPVTGILIYLLPLKMQATVGLMTGLITSGSTALSNLRR